MELSDYLRILRAHWVGVLALTLAGVAAAAVYNLTQPQVYAANANGFVSSGQNSDPALASVSDSLAKSRAKSYVDIAKSRATAQEVIDALDLAASPQGLIGQITVEQPLDTVLIKITARASTPEGAQELADAWVTALASQVEEIENPDNSPRGAALSVVPVEAAELPTSPVLPRVELNLAVGLAAGLLLGFAYAMLRNQLDRRLRTTEQITALGVPVAGAIPLAQELQRDKEGHLPSAMGSAGDRRLPASSEAFRKLRTNLQFMDVDNPPRVVVVTSPEQGDGKSTVAINLASVIAMSGEKVTLVDADLRRPNVATSLGLVEGAGLTDVLAGSAQLDDVLQRHGLIETLHILAAGRVPPNPSELLGSKSMRALLRQLAERSTVIVDAAPLLPVTDAAVLTAIADGAFIVISSGKTLDEDLAGALRNLEAVRGRALGVIVNRVKVRDRDYGYYGQAYEKLAPATPEA